MKKLALILGIILPITLSAQLAELDEEVTGNWVQSEISGRYEILPRTLNVGPSRQYTTIEEALAAVGDVLYNTTITISIDSGSYEFNDACRREISGRIRAINSTLEFLGADLTIIEDGVSLSKDATRMFNYNATKAGLTVTEDELKNYWMADAAEANFYPIGWNSAGTDNFVIAFSHHNKAAYSKITEWDVTLTNPGDGTWLDFAFKTNISSIIKWSHLNITSGAEGNYFENGRQHMRFDACYLTGDRLHLGRTQGNWNGSVLELRSSQIGLTGTSGATIYIQNVPRGAIYFNRCFIDGTTLATNAVIDLAGGYPFFDKRNLLRGNGNIPAFWGTHVDPIVLYENGIAIYDCSSIMDFSTGSSLLPLGTAEIVDFQNVDYYFEDAPLSGCQVTIPNITGTPPSGIYSDAGSYSFFNPTERIQINITGLDSLSYRPETKWHRVDTVDVVQANAWRDVKFNYMAWDESTWGFSPNADSTALVAKFDGLVSYNGSGHYIWRGAAGTAVNIRIRVVVDGSENRCSQTHELRTISTGDKESMRYLGSSEVTIGSIIKVQYNVTNVDLDWEGEAAFDNPISWTFHAIATQIYN